MPYRIPSQVFSEPVINIPGGGLFYLTKQNETIPNIILAGVFR